MSNPHKTAPISSPSPQGTLDYLFDATSDSRAYSVRSSGILVNNLYYLEHLLQ